MPISNPDQLKPGDVLVRRFKGKVWRCEVAQIGNGLGYRLEDGREFRSPSIAGKAITGTECSGYVWWHRADDPPAKRGPKPGIQRIAAMTGMPGMVSLDGAQSAPTHRNGKQNGKHNGHMNGIASTATPLEGFVKVTVPATATPARQPRMYRVIRESAYQAGLKRGETRFWCADCERNFISAKKVPARCPVGHEALRPSKKPKQELTAVG